MSSPEPRSAAARPGLEVRLEGLRRRYGSVVALDGFDLTMSPGELVALLGPSGCGKTTTLRLLAGLEDADGGRVVVGGNDITHIPASKRNMGMVFQAYSLFPHLTVRQNVAFGLRLRGVDKAARDRRALEMLELVGLSAQADRFAQQISGGQQQRVALARALAIEPQVLLLDEPLSALDAKVRAQLRDQIRRIQLEVGITTLFVTHDQEEALAIADRVGVMKEGRLEQLGSPTDVYSRPASSFVAEFVGLTNRLQGIVSDGRVTVRGLALPLVDQATPNGSVAALVRPEAVTLAADASGDSGPLTGTVIATTFLGATSRITVDLGDTTIMAQLPTSDAATLPAGSRVSLIIRDDPVLVAQGPAAAAAAEDESAVAVSGVHPSLTLATRIGPGRVLARGTERAYRSLAITDGEPHAVRTDLIGRDGLAGPSSVRSPLLCFVHLTDLQLADVQSPARFEFFNREFGDPRFAALVPVQRPQEALTPHAVAAMVRAINAVRTAPGTGAQPELVVTTGDSIDNAQWNEMTAVLNLLEGGTVRLDSGLPGYEGVQAPGWPDHNFWRPDGGPGPRDVFRAAFGFPLHTGLLESAIAEFLAEGLHLPWLACYGNHEALIQGVGAITPGIAAALVGAAKPSRMKEETSRDDALEIFITHVDAFMSGDPVPVSADPDRRALTRREFVDAHFRSGARPAGHGFTEANRRQGTAHYVHDVGPVRFIALDTVCVTGGAAGALDEDQAAWLTGRLAEVHSTYRTTEGSVVRTSNPDRLVVVLSHHGLDTMTNERGRRPGPGDGPQLGAAGLLALLHRFANVVLWINGHTHTNSITPRPDPSDPPRGFWEVTTCSLVDWPCQARLIELVDDGDGELSIVCTMIDHDGAIVGSGGWPERGWSGSELAGLHRELAANVPWAGWDSPLAGTSADRNVVLRLRAPFPMNRIDPR
jgi:metallophosphoesterase (TIGR03767 family)